MNDQHYAMVIEWSEQDQAYIVSFPEWEQAGHIAHIHGETYAEAVGKGEEMLTFLIESTREEGEMLAEPRIFAASTMI